MSKQRAKVIKTDAQWRSQLTPQQYEVSRLGGTEPAFTGVYWDSEEEGIYKCIGCDTPLFSSDTKYDSGSGWPSFWGPLDKEAVRFEQDTSRGMVRTEVLCATCDAHLGHIFEDGPQPTGVRYCMNSASLNLEHKDK